MKWKLCGIGDIIKPLVFVIVFVSSSIAQTLEGITSDLLKNQVRTINVKDGQTVLLTSFADSVDLKIFDVTEVVELIVEFVEEPMFLRKDRGIALFRSGFPASRLAQFTNDVQSLENQVARQLNLNLARTSVHDFYSRVFFGASLKTTRAMMPEIQRLPYVKKIHYDHVVKAYLDESVGLIKADLVWNRLESRGDGVIVGVFDTGIDYTHPALGGGFGPGFKVMGGYDLVNNDSDPRDDQGHGTHVAGIIAANGNDIKGVAPGAKLMAFKVLDANGAGNFRMLLSAIERAVDPNQDGDYSDRVDIVNVSLGGAGDPDDALSTAVDNATRIGLTFCVAAGNNGDFRAIGSPGMSRLAITVGASDKSDKLASFSSKGPNSKIYSIKPEVVAPGVSIRSLAVGGGFTTLSGTSMAAPHVAGVAALLKSLHKDWSPLRIKSALITTAQDLGYEVMAQGAGRIDAFKAASVSAFAVPAHLSYGVDDLNLSSWTNAETVMVYNSLNREQRFAFSYTALQSGIVLQALPQSFTLAPGDSQRLVINILVSNVILPDPQGGSLCYSGFAYFSGNKDTLRLPWAFVKAPIVHLTFDGALPALYFVGEKNRFSSSWKFWADPQSFEFITAKGTYDMVVVFFTTPPKAIFRELVSVQGPLQMTISASEATNEVKLNGVDSNGTPLASYGKLWDGIGIYFPIQPVYTVFGIPAPRYFSNISERFAILFEQFHYDLASTRSAHLVQFPVVRNIDRNLILQNSPTDYVSQNFQFVFPPNTSRPSVTMINWIRTDFYTLGFTDSLRAISQGWKGTFYHTPDPHPRLSFSISPMGSDDKPFSASSQPDFTVPPSMVVNDSIVYSWSRNPLSTDYVDPSGATMFFGEPPLYVNFVTPQNDMTTIALWPNYHGLFSEYRGNDVNRTNYVLYDGSGTVVDSGAARLAWRKSVMPGRYTLEYVHKNFFVGNTQSKAILRLSFDLKNADPNPPQMTSLRLFNSNGVLSSRLMKGERATLKFSANDSRAIGNYNSNGVLPVLSWRRFESSDWKSISVNKLFESDELSVSGPLGSGYEADLTDATQFDSTAIDLRIELRDLSGNLTQWTLEPGFAVGKYVRDLTAIKEEPSVHVPAHFALYQNYPNPFNPRTIIRFDVPFNRRVLLKVFNILGQEIRTLVDEQLQSGKYSIEWDGIDNRGLPMTSGVYFYQLLSDTFISTRRMLILK